MYINWVTTSWTYSKLLYKMGHYFLERQYIHKPKLRQDFMYLLFDKKNHFQDINQFTRYFVN